MLIYAFGSGDLQKALAVLPTKPDGDGSCQLIRRKSGNNYIVVAEGACKQGKRCSLKTSIGPPMPKPTITWIATCK